MSVSLVIPGYNCERTIRACLDAVVPLLTSGQLAEIIFVDDGSTDQTAAIVAEYPIRIVHGNNGGAGAARNLGWQAAQHELIWFIDSDCVAEPDALAQLLPHLQDDHVAGAGGSYGNMCPDSLVASLIHEEIVARHARMPARVNFLGTFNVLYRRDLIAKVGGFDECRYNGPGVAGAEDAELAFRLVRAGYQLAFEPLSRVGHFHLRHYDRYLRVQQRHGFYRVRLYLDYPQRMPGDSYSGPIDHLQPPLAILILASLPLLMWPAFATVPLAATAILVALQLPMSIALVSRNSLIYLAYIPFGFFRAFRRGFGMAAGAVEGIWEGAKQRYALTGTCGTVWLAQKGHDSMATQITPSLVSVIVCVRNRPAQIRDCLESLLASRHCDPLEIVVVDDASTDSTPEVVTSIAADSAGRIRLVRNPVNLGVSGARNVGIQTSRGEYLLFTDSDCLVRPDWIGKMVSALATGNQAACGYVIDRPPVNVAEMAYFGNTSLCGSRLQGRSLVGNNMGFRRATLESVRFDELLSYYCDDDDIALRIRRLGGDIAFVSDAVVEHRHGMTLRGYCLTAYKQGQGSARYWFKHGQIIGRDVACSCLAMLLLPLLLVTRQLLLPVLVLGALQILALLVNELLFKKASITRTLYILPILIVHNVIKSVSVLVTIARILLGSEQNAWLSRRRWQSERVQVFCWRT